VASEQKQTSDAANVIPTVKSILSKIDPKKLRLAEEMGIPLKELLIWAQSVENTQNAIIESLNKLPTNEGIAEELNRKLQANAEAQRTEIAQRPRNASSSDGKTTVSDIIAFLKESGGGGGGDSAFFADLGKAWMSRKLASEDFGEFMSKEMFKRVFPDAIKAWEDKVAERAAATKPAGT
jgi:hypothetical protein